jgi:hypothetical protein
VKGTCKTGDYGLFLCQPTLYQGSTYKFVTDTSGGKDSGSGTGSGSSSGGNDNGGGVTDVCAGKSCSNPGIAVCVSDAVVRLCEKDSNGCSVDTDHSCTGGTSCDSGTCAITNVNNSTYSNNAVLKAACQYQGGTWDDATSHCSRVIVGPVPSIINSYWWLILVVIAFIVFGVVAYLIRTGVIKRKGGRITKHITNITRIRRT